MFDARTPHVLAQVSDLTDVQDDQEFRKIRRQYRSLVEPIEEVYDPGRELVADPLFERLALTDTAIAKVCSRGLLVLTADVQLHIQLELRGLDALNFNHVRALGWNSPDLNASLQSR